MDRSASGRWSIVAVAITVAFVGVAAFSFAPGTVSASEDFDLWVGGTVYDDGGLPAEGASIVIEDLATHATASATTDEFGEYFAYIDQADWTAGDMIEVVCTYNTVQKTNSSVADEFATVTIDIHYDYAIPEFGSFPGVLVATLMVGAIAVISVRRRKAQ